MSNADAEAMRLRTVIAACPSAAATLPAAAAHAIPSSRSSPPRSPATGRPAALRPDRVVRLRPRHATARRRRKAGRDPLFIRCWRPTPSAPTGASTAARSGARARRRCTPKAAPSTGISTCATPPSAALGRHWSACCSLRTPTATRSGERQPEDRLTHRYWGRRGRDRRPLDKPPHSIVARDLVGAPRGDLHVHAGLKRAIARVLGQPVAALHRPLPVTRSATAAPQHRHRRCADVRARRPGRPGGRREIAHGHLSGFPDDASLTSLSAMLCIEHNDDWLVGQRYVSAREMEPLLQKRLLRDTNLTTEEVLELRAA